MARNIELLLTENVEALGIVGDVVKVRTGYARNFLLPRNLATTPTDEMIKSLASKRADAERQLAELRRHREGMIQKMTGTQVETIRSTNDQGVLYAAVTQQDIADLLAAQGYALRPRDVRLSQTIKRIGTYEVHIKFEADLEAVVKLVVTPDRKLDLHDEPAEPAPAAVPAEGAASAEGEPASPPAAPRGKHKPGSDDKHKGDDKAEPKAKSLDWTKGAKAPKDAAEKKDAPESHEGAKEGKSKKKK